MENNNGTPDPKEPELDQESEESEESLDQKDDGLFMAEDDNRILIINNIEPPRDEKFSFRVINLYGDVTEHTSADVVSALMYFKETGKKQVYVDPEDPESEIVTVHDPIEMIVSTHGGHAADMFSIYDTMRMVRQEYDISTVGLGKVMSAGVLLLAAGTKGKRKIGRNCRVMIHSVMGGYHGSLPHMENEIAEVRWIQSQYVKNLAQETNMDEKKIKSLLKKKVDVYLSAEEAVDLGLADEII